MSWDVYLERDGETVEVPSHTEGGTIAIGGDDRAELNVTYNYSEHYPFRSLDGATARDTIGILRDAVATLGTERDSDYWASTPGNAGHALSVLLRWAEAHPDAVWRVS